MSMKTLTALGDIWQTDQLDLLEFAAKNAVPRQGSRLLQLRRDLRSPLMWLIIAVASAGIAFGVLAYQPILAVYATLILAIVGFMFISVAKTNAHSPLMRGVIKSADCLQTHPMGLGFVARASVDSDGPVLQVNVSLTNAHAADLLRENGRLDVLVLFEPKAQYSSVIGWRVPA